MAVGTAIKILEKEGYVSRPNERTTNSFLKTIKPWDEIISSISTRAKVQLAIAEKLRERYEEEIKDGWQFVAEEAALSLRVKKDVLNRAIKKMAEQDLIEYRPPFKGTEIRILKETDPEEIDVDFSALEEKAGRARAKLEEMESYVHTSLCRQQFILKYFGEEDTKPCGHCDNCMRRGKMPKREYLASY